MSLTPSTLIALSLAILFIACSPTYILQSHDNKVIGVQSPIDSSILAIITPYQNGIEDLMNEVLTYTKNDLKKGKALHHQLFELNESVFYDTNPIPIKYMMKRMGLLLSNEHRLPMSPATPELEKRLDGVLERAGLL